MGHDNLKFTVYRSTLANILELSRSKQQSSANLGAYIPNQFELHSTQNGHAYPFPISRSLMPCDAC